MQRGIFAHLFLFVGIHIGTAPAASQQRMLFQELGVVYTTSGSGHVELPSPMGFGVFSRWAVGDGWLLRVSFNRSAEETRKESTVCAQPIPRISCALEPTETSVTLSGLRVAFSRAMRFGNRVEIDLGGGLSFNRVKADALSLSGGPTDLLAPNTGQLGFLASASVALAPVRSLPILLVGGFTMNWVDFNSCSPADVNQYDPFCGLATLRELELGLSYVF